MMITLWEALHLECGNESWREWPHHGSTNAISLRYSIISTAWSAGLMQHAVILRQQWCPKDIPPILPQLSLINTTLLNGMSQSRRPTRNASGISCASNIQMTCKDSKHASKITAGWFDQTRTQGNKTAVL